MKAVNVRERKKKVVMVMPHKGDIARDIEVEAHTDLCVVVVLVGSSATIRVRLVGSGSTASIFGFVQGTGSDVVTLHTMQIHEAPETTSNLLVKSVLTGSAVFRYEGAIRVEKKAQKTDAYQRNENLLVSPDAHAESKPQLEILADDVRCTHGATIGSVSQEQLWYLMSRGIRKEAATKLIVDGFLLSGIDRIDDDVTKKRVLAAFS